MKRALSTLSSFFLFTDLDVLFTDCIGIGNSMICGDIWHKYQDLYFKIVIRNFGTVLKYHEWYLCLISRTNYAIICLYYYP